MIGSPAGVSTAASVISALLSLVELALEHMAVARHEKAEGEINYRSEYIRLDIEALPVGVGQCRIGGAKQIEQADDGDERGVLEPADKVVDEGRNDHRQRLRQHDQPGPAPIA